MGIRHKTLAAGVALVMVGAAQSALINRGGGMIYDDVLKITWLQDWNQAAGSSFDNGTSASDGRMTGDNAKAWADSLVYGGFSDWRLPTMVDTGTLGCDVAFAGTDCGYNSQTKSGTLTQYEAGQTVYSEMAHLWYVTLGNRGFYDTAGTPFQAGWGLSNSGVFQNIQTDAAYWSGLDYPQMTSPSLWVFNMGYGDQGNSTIAADIYAVAVRDGDVAAAVPEPATLALVGAALVGVSATRRRKLAAPTT